jgi:hypothetical protein
VGATSKAGTAYPLTAPEFIPVLKWGPCYSISLYHCLSSCPFWIVCPLITGRSRRGRDRMVVEFTTLPMKSVQITF